MEEWRREYIRGDPGPCSASRKRTTMNVVVRFLHFFVHSIQLTAPLPNASVTNHVRTRGPNASIGGRYDTGITPTNDRLTHTAHSDADGDCYDDVGECNDDVGERNDDDGT